MNRRDLLAGSAGAAAMATLARASGAAAQVAGPPAGEAGRLNALFDAIMKENLDRSPEFATSLGLDMGPRAAQKARLDDRSVSAWEGDKRRTADQLARLRGVDRAALGPQDRVNLDSVVYVTALSDEGNRRFPFIGGPYVVSQLTGAYQGVPDFLDTQHAIETKTDADDYLSRLDAFATAMDQEDAAVRHDVGLGVTPPDFILDKSLIQMRALRDAPPATSNLVQSVARRAREKGIAGDYAGQASALYTGKVQPALDRQIALMTELRAKASHDAGVARLPQGEEFYALSLKQWTTSDMAPAEIHRTGLDLVASHQSQLDALMKSQGLSQGTVGERFPGALQRSQVPLPEHRRGQGQADRRPEPRGGRGPGQAARLVRDFAQGQAGHPPRTQGYRGRRAGRATTSRAISQARGPAPTTSTYATRPRSRAGPCRPSPSTRAYRATTCRARWRSRPACR